MSQKTHLSISKRSEIVQGFLYGERSADLARMHGISQKTVYNLVNKYSQDKELKNKPKSGRKRVTSRKEDRVIQRLCQKNPRLGTRNITKDACETIGRELSQPTVRRRLKEFGFKCYIARKQPLISEKNKKLRLEFARKYISKPSAFWENVLFTDESSFSYHGSYGRVYIHMKPQKRGQQRPSLPTQRHGGGTVMFWGCISVSSVGSLVEVQGTMNQSKYIEVLNDYACPSGDNLIGSDFVLQQDNAPCHKGKIVSKFIDGIGLATLDWPPQSPDLNIIENLWAYVKQKRTIALGQTKEEAVENIKAIWENISIDYLINLYKSIPKRLQAVIDAKGANTKY